MNHCGSPNSFLIGNGISTVEPGNAEAEEETGEAPLARFVSGDDEEATAAAAAAAAAASAFYKKSTGT